jgi:hypothetical protein
MPVTYQVDRESVRIRTRCTGDVTFEEVLDHFRQLRGDASLPPRLDVLLDLAAMESLPESNQLRSIADEVDRLKPRLKWGACAIVANRDALYGMLRMFQVFAEKQFASSYVFREREEAERWLESLRAPAAGKRCT